MGCNAGVIIITLSASSYWTGPEAQKDVIVKIGNEVYTSKTRRTINQSLGESEISSPETLAG